MSTSDYSALAHEWGLERVGARPPLTTYLKELWNRRALALTMARFSIQSTMSENRLGLGWVVLQPLLNAALYGLVFGIIMASSSRPHNFIPFLISGVFIFQYFAKSFSNGARSVTSNLSLVRSLSFPRMLLPIATVLQQMFELIPMIAVMSVILVVFGEPITWGWLLVPLILGLMTLFNFGVALIAARLTVHFRDFTMIIPLVVRLLFYASGIFYSLELVLKDRPKLLQLIQLNPVHDYITLVRAQMVTGTSADPELWLVAIGFSLVALALGVIFFWQAEERYGHD